MAETAHQHVVTSIRESIVRGDLRPGVPVLADAVAEQLGVSRIPVREALRMLEAEGLVRSEPHKGVIVATLNAVDLHEIYLLRRLLETEAVRRAVGGLSRATLAEMEAILDRIDAAIEAGDTQLLIDLNRRFHFTLYDASHLERLTRIVRMLWNQSDAYRSVYLGVEENCRAAQREHRAVLDAAKARDAERVVELLDQHRRNAEVAVTAALRS